MRIAIVGCSCAGKSTMARKIGAELGIRVVDLDDLHWLPGWKEVPDEELRVKVEEFTAEEEWVTAGNYRVVRDIIWGRATHIIWLNYSFRVVWSRALWRTFSRVFTRELVCNGNRESLRLALFSKESILLWVLQTYSKRKVEFADLLKESKYSHIEVMELNKPNERVFK